MMDEIGRRLARGERGAFADLYNACADRLHYYLRARLGCGQDADDVLQETFVRLARTHKRLRGVANLTGYVFAVARNEAARLASRRARQPKSQVGPGGDLLFLEAASDDVQCREAAELVAAGLARLGPANREIVELKIYAGLTFRQIAEVTGLPQGTVATRYRAALGQLRAWFARELS